MRLRIYLRTKRNPGGIPPGMMRALRYAPYAIRHHWTPKQVDEEIPADVEPYLLDVEALLEEEAKRNAQLRRP
jgi:hypothetical protein